MPLKRQASKQATESIQNLAKNLKNKVSASAKRQRVILPSANKVPGGSRAREGYLFEQAVVRNHMSDLQIEETKKGSDFDGIDHRWGLDISIKKKNHHSSMDELEDFLTGKISECKKKPMLALEFASMKRVTGYTRPFTFVFQFKGKTESILVWGYAREGVHMFLSYLQVAELYRKICEGCGVGVMTNFRNENRTLVGKVCTRACRRIDSLLPEKYMGLLNPRSKISRPKPERGISGQIRLQTVVDFCKLLRLNPIFVYLRVPNDSVNNAIPLLRSMFDAMMKKKFSGNRNNSWQNFTPTQIKERKDWVEKKMADVGFPETWSRNSFLEFSPRSKRKG